MARPTWRQVYNKAAEMPDDYLLCARATGTHHWHATKVEFDGPEFLQHERCPSCTSTRVTRLDRRGRIITRRTQYAKGYLLTNLGRLDAEARGAFRIAAIQRFEEDGR